MKKGNIIFLIIAVLVVAGVIVLISVSKGTPAATKGLTAATSTATESQATSTKDSTNQKTSTSTMKTKTLPDGLQITDITVGTRAEAAAGDTVTVDYTGTLTDGKVFDSTSAHGQPFSFVLGAGQVIRGWDEGIVGMRVGGERKLVIPPSLAYGNQSVGNGLIPANSTLIFTVKLLAVQP